jgi:hypothetical protein
MAVKINFMCFWNVTPCRSCERGNEPSGSIKFRKFRDLLSECYAPTKTAPWSSLVIFSFILLNVQFIALPVYIWS